MKLKLIFHCEISDCESDASREQVELAVAGLAERLEAVISDSVKRVDPSIVVDFGTGQEPWQE